MNVDTVPYTPSDEGFAVSNYVFEIIHDTARNRGIEPEYQLINHIHWELAFVHDLVTNRTPICIPDCGFIIQWGVYFGASLLTLTKANKDTNSKYAPVVGIDLFSHYIHAKDFYIDVRDNISACGFNVKDD